ncbi:hypothetical protein AJ79_03985 [Helicocarpus griseus UAMH5409]|uniref:Origin recognition complex subunit 4 n=1 Tax=Helicocarpus griseus UAMH5409 TaxID=1447875 RepID=A0A2B7XVB6_9EURO|nr:hypothetical protein AJ79_03985 [Helicocarpus griseus UAMH5409]
MGGFATSSRPSKRRRVAGGAVEETPTNGRARGATNRKSVRFEDGREDTNGVPNGNGDATAEDGDQEAEAEEGNGEESKPSSPPLSSAGRKLRSSTRQRSAPKRYTEVEEVEKVKRPVRRRKRDEGQVEKVDQAAMDGQGEDEKTAPNTLKTKRQKKGVNGTKTERGAEGNADVAGGARRTQSRTKGKKAGVNTRRKKDMRDVSSDDNEEEATEEDQMQNGVTDKPEFNPSDQYEEEAEVDAENAEVDDHDMSALQLQQELMDDDTPVAETEELPGYATDFKALCEENKLEVQVACLSKYILNKLTGKKPIPIRCLDSQYQTVHQLVEQTVVAGEGNSLLLLGSKGCGKTAVVESVISSLAKEHRDDFHVVRLNGFIHTDDRIALREIWRQLGREMNVEDEMSKSISYADTMASLLALLSHPEELFGVSEDPNAIATAKSVIIILDEFDLFAHHPRQTLLYNLFDIAQARKAPLAVLGLTTKVDVTENLEKRVKSRFSHRYVFLPRPRTFGEFSDICKAAVGLGEEDLTRGGLDNLDSEEGRLLLNGWEEYIQGLWTDHAFQTHLQRIYHQTKSPKDFFASALLPISSLYHGLNSSELRPPTPKSFYSHPLSCPDPASLPFPPSTSSTSNTSLPLSLLLAATRLTALHDSGLNTSHPQTTAPLTLSFPAAYAEYVRLLTSAKISASASGAAATPGRVWGKDVAREAWERLVGWGLVVPVGGGSGMGDGRMFRIEISFEEVLDGVGDSGVGALGRWWRET